MTSNSYLTTRDEYEAAILRTAIRYLVREFKGRFTWEEQWYKTEEAMRAAVAARRATDKHARLVLYAEGREFGNPNGRKVMVPLSASKE